MILGFQAFLESKSQHCPSENIKKNNVFSMFLGCQAFQESFKIQDSPTKNPKKHIDF